jgi:chorismate mutase
MTQTRDKLDLIDFQIIQLFKQRLDTLNQTQANVTMTQQEVLPMIISEFATFQKQAKKAQIRSVIIRKIYRLIKQESLHHLQTNLKHKFQVIKAKKQKTKKPKN